MVKTDFLDQESENPLKNLLEMVKTDFLDQESENPLKNLPGRW